MYVYVIVMHSADFYDVFLSVYSTEAKAQAYIDASHAKRDAKGRKRHNFTIKQEWMD